MAPQNKKDLDQFGQQVNCFGKLHYNYTYNRQLKAVWPSQNIKSR